MSRLRKFLLLFLSALLLAASLAPSVSAQRPPEVAVPGKVSADGFVTRLGSQFIGEGRLMVVGRLVATSSTFTTSTKRQVVVEQVAWGNFSSRTIDVVATDSAAFNTISDRCALILEHSVERTFNLVGNPQPIASNVVERALLEYLEIERSRESISTRVEMLRGQIVDHLAVGGIVTNFALGELHYTLSSYPDIWSHDHFETFNRLKENYTGGQRARMELAIRNLVTLVLKPNAQVAVRLAETAGERDQATRRLENYFQRYPETFAAQDAERCDLIMNVQDNNNVNALLELRRKISIEVLRREQERLAREAEAELRRNLNATPTEDDEGRIVTESGSGDSSLRNLFTPDSDD